MTAGARKEVLRSERQRFLKEKWPGIRETIQRLGFTAEDLLKRGATPRSTPGAFERSR